MVRKDDFDPIGKEMGHRLRAQRERKGWTQRQLAEATGWREDDPQSSGISQSAIGNYEQGTRRFAHEEAAEFEKIFGLPAAYFLVMVDEREAAVIAAMRKAG